MVRRAGDGPLIRATTWDYLFANCDARLRLARFELVAETTPFT
jgi:hypothetical protein